ncbi:5' nucleotidase, NT5C type [Flavobacterium fluviale]|uniref:5'(3')-deoxyribonucleotidase n=1 Tax=Flavobacterium fluviale TaxID=2249356 RepID=A0A344LWS2_9FLAO|nr:5'(3')-deoxyribonucleotidase [Flavobacterium fluviale]
MKKTIAIDMDGVLADIESHFLRRYLTETGITLTRSDIIEPKGAQTLESRTTAYLNEPGFFRSIPVMQGAVEAVKKLMEDFDVYIVSAAMEFPLSLFEKQQWLAEHFPFIKWNNIVLCGDKNIIKTDYLIDDHCKNLDYCHGKAIMFDAYHNLDKHQHQRVKSWTEVLMIMRGER